MSRIVILGDLHFGVKGASDIMFKHQKKFFDSLFSYMEKEGIKVIFQLGDIFDNRKYINFKTLEFAKREFFDRIEDQGITLHTLIGNHDIFYRERTDTNASDLLLDGYHSVKVYQTPTTVEVFGKTFDFIPWICEENRVECYNFIRQSKSTYCLGHFELNNFLMYTGVLFTGGMDCSLLKNYHRVFTGHFHIKSEGENVLYVGTPYELNWNDANTPKGFHVLDCTDGSLSFIENNEHYYKYLRYDEFGSTTTDIRNMDLEDCFLRIHIISKSEPWLYEKFIQDVYSKHPADAKFIERDILQETEDLQEEAKDINDSTDTESIIKDYIDKLDINNKEKFQEFILGLYHEALTVQER